MEEQPDKKEWKTRTRNPINKNMNVIFMELLDKEIGINKINIATKLAIEENKKKTEKTDKELVPEEYHKYLDVFNEKKAAQFPELKSWDHKIKMKEGFEPKSFKNYSLTLAENNLNWTTSSKKTSKKDISNHQNHPWYLHFSLYLRRMENSDCVKIIDILTIGQ